MERVSHYHSVLRYAVAWNTLDISPIEGLLDNESVYESQWVLTALVGKSQILEYLSGKFNTLRNLPESKPFAEIGYHPMEGYCVLMAQGSKENLRALVALEVIDSFIKRVDICSVPSPWEATRTGNYPFSVE